MINITKCVLNDFGISPLEVATELELLKQLDMDEKVEELEENEFADYRKSLRLNIRKQLEQKGGNLAIDEALVQHFESPLENNEGSPAWLRPFCLEFILTAVLDSKPGFETTEEWDEEVLLENVNQVLEPHKLKIAYDPNYDWESLSGEALVVHLETTDGKNVESASYTFPDPEQFDQPELMEPVNTVLASKGLKFVDASYVTEDAASYNWILMPVEEAQRLTEKYGALPEWYKEFVQDDEEGEEGAYEEGMDDLDEEEEEGEPAPPSRNKKPEPKKVEPPKKPNPPPKKR